MNSTWTPRNRRIPAACCCLLRSDRGFASLSLERHCPFANQTEDLRRSAASSATPPNPIRIRLAGSGTAAGEKSISHTYCADTSPTGPDTPSNVVETVMLLLFIAVRIALQLAAFTPAQLNTFTRLPGALEMSAPDPHWRSNTPVTGSKTRLLKLEMAPMLFTEWP